MIFTKPSKSQVKAGLFGDPVLTLFCEKHYKNVPIVIRLHVSGFVFYSGGRLVDTRFEFLIYTVSYIFPGFSRIFQPAAGAIFKKKLRHNTVRKHRFEHDFGVNKRVKRALQYNVM